VVSFVVGFVGGVLVFVVVVGQPADYGRGYVTVNAAGWGKNDVSLTPVGREGTGPQGALHTHRPPDTTPTTIREPDSTTYPPTVSFPHPQINDDF
jgi:hypothetical protein